jgi:ribonuclease E
MAKEICISSTPHETRLAILEDDQLAEIYYERENEYTLAGSIYNGRVTRVLPGMQSAFVDLGLERDAFLYVTDFIELEDQAEAEELEHAAASGATQPPREVRHGNGSRREERGQRGGAQEQREEYRGEDRYSAEEEERFAQAAPEAAEAAGPAPEAAARPGEESDAQSNRRWRGRRHRRGRGRRSRRAQKAAARSRHLRQNRRPLKRVRLLPAGRPPAVASRNHPGPTSVRRPPRSHSSFRVSPCQNTPERRSRSRSGPLPSARKRRRSAPPSRPR